MYINDCLQLPTFIAVYLIYVHSYIAYVAVYRMCRILASLSQCTATEQLVSAAAAAPSCLPAKDCESEN